MPHPFLPLFEPTVDLTRTDAQQPPRRPCGGPEAPPHPRHPQGQQGLQAHRARIAGGLPDGTQDGDHSGAVGRRTSPLSRALPPGAWSSTVQQTDGVLSVVARVATKLVQDHLLLPQVSLTVTRVNRHKIFSSCPSIHSNPPGESPLRVTSKTAQRVTFLNGSTRAYRLHNRRLNSGR